MAACCSLDMTQTFTSYHHPKDNVDTERVIRTLKADLIRPREWTRYQQLENALKRWVKDYNEDFRHAPNRSLNTGSIRTETSN